MVRVYRPLCNVAVVRTEEKVKATSLVLCLVLLLVGAAQANDSLNVRLIGSCDTPGDARGLAVSGSYAFIADWNAGLRVISVADPAHPVEVGHADGPDSAIGVAVSGSYAYVIDLSAGLRVISIADPAHPTEVGYHDTPGLAYCVAVNGNYAYVADMDSGLWVISIADPAHPTMAGHLDLQWALSLAASGHFVYVADHDYGLRVISVVDPASPLEVGYNDSIGMTTRVAANGGYAYVGGGDGLFVISVADSSHPVEVGRCNTGDAVNGLAFDDYVYAVGYSKLYVVSVSSPTFPDTVGYYHKPFWDARALAAAGDYVYVIGDSGLSVCQRYDAGVEEATNAELRTARGKPTVVRGVLMLGAVDRKQQVEDRAELLDATGRRVMDLRPGANDVSALASGVYFVRGRSATNGERPEVSVRKAIIGR